MRLIPFRLNVSKRPRPLDPRLVTLMSSTADHENMIKAMTLRMGDLEKRIAEVAKQSEATRRKVYRDLEGGVPELPPEGNGQTPPGQTLPMQNLRPGDNL